MAKSGEINCPRCAELETRIEELTELCALEYQRAWLLETQKNIAEEKLAQQDDLVQAAVERGFWLGRSCGGSKAEIDAALAAICAGNNVLCVSCGAPTPNDFCGFCLEEE
jgi:hypothetical protein